MSTPVPVDNRRLPGVQSYTLTPNLWHNEGVPARANAGDVTNHFRRVIDVSDSTWITPDDVWRMNQEREDRFTDALSDLVAAAGPVWGLGDGYGGWVQMKIHDALTSAYGPFGDPPRRRKGAVRRKISSKVRIQVMERDRYRCVSCGSWENLGLDHIHPLSKGGSDEPDNLQTMCQSCNSTKGTRVGER